MKTLITAILIIFFIPGLSIGDEIRIPNKFESDDLIEAEKFNENYIYIEDHLKNLNRGIYNLRSRLEELEKIQTTMQRKLSETNANNLQPDINQLKENLSKNTDRLDRKIDAISRKNPIPKGTVAAFALQNCPAGWSYFDEGAGRVIIGVNKGKGLTLKNTGGKEKHTHRGQISDQQVKGNSYGGRIHGHSDVHGKHYPVHFHQIKIMEESSLPPFIALRFCVKN